MGLLPEEQDRGKYPLKYSDTDDMLRKVINLSEVSKPVQTITARPWISTDIRNYTLSFDDTTPTGREEVINKDIELWGIWLQLDNNDATSEEDLVYWYLYVVTDIGTRTMLIGGEKYLGLEVGGSVQFGYADYKSDIRGLIIPKGSRLGIWFFDGDLDEYEVNVSVQYREL